MTFQWPFLLFSLLLVPILAALYLRAQRRRRSYAIRFTNLALLGAVAGRGPGLRRHVPPVFYILGLTLLLVAVARPTAVIAVPRDQTSVMLVMDVSGSMAADDLQPNRMVAAKQAARAFVTSLPPNVRVGLVSFSTGASVEAPLTDDRQAVLQVIDSLSAEGGTAMGDGLNLALRQLTQHAEGESVQETPGVVVLLSDGAPSRGDSPEAAAERARRAKIKVHTVGVGRRGATPLIDGRRPVQLDEATLQEIARTTDGTYFYAPDARRLERIYAELGSTISWVAERTEITALASAAGTLLLVAAGLLSLRWFQQLP